MQREETNKKAQGVLGCTVRAFLCRVGYWFPGIHFRMQNEEMSNVTASPESEQCNLFNL